MIILFISGVLVILNSNAGWLWYQLLSVFFIVYVLAGLLSPLVGIVALVFWGVTKQKFKGDTKGEQDKLRNHIFVLGLIDIFAVIIWIILFPLVFFSAGGSR